FVGGHQVKKKLLEAKEAKAK
ncbi:hypothetical protein Tco_0740916, partial [Tanacetum coccineum]